MQNIDNFTDNDNDYIVEIESNYINHDFDDIDDSEPDESEYESDIEFE